jgi:hypothetical protein
MKMAGLAKKVKEKSENAFCGQILVQTDSS